MQFNDSVQRYEDSNKKSFESILSEKLQILTDVDQDISDLRFSITKCGNDYSGTLVLKSPRGNFFATAVANEILDVTLSLKKQIIRQVEQPSYEKCLFLAIN